MDYGNMLTLGGFALDNAPTTRILKPEELWNLDTKMDDGKPATGKVIARFYGTCTNAGSATDTSANYLLTSSSLGCTAIFRNLF